MKKYGKTVLGAAATAVLLAAGSANAALIDFTDDPAPAGVTLTGFPVAPGVGTGPESQPPFAPLPYADSFATVLVGNNDGLGIRNSELANDPFNPPPQSITVTFAEEVRLVAAYFLDIYQSISGNSAEEAIVTVVAGKNAGASASVFGTETSGDFENVAGRGFLETDLVGSSFTFTAAQSNDGFGSPDYALAAIRIAAIPLPASALLLLAGLGGLAMVRRTKTA